MKSGGYQGHFPWTSNLASTSSEIGTLTDFGPASLSFENANTNLVYPPSSCSLPVTFIDIGIRNQGNETILYWAIAADDIQYADFTIYASMDGINFGKVGSTLFVEGEMYYTFPINEQGNNYFYVEIISDKAAVERTSVVYAGRSSEDIYKICYTTEEEPVLYLYSNGAVNINLVSVEGKSIHTEEYQEPVVLPLKNYTTAEGLYLLQLSSGGKYYQNKIVIK